MAGFDPADLQQTVTTSAAQSLILVPELLKAWTLYLSASGQKAPKDLVFVAVGGARVDSALLGHARALGIPAYEGYGLTECGSVVSLNLPGDDGSGVGRPLPHVELRLENGQIHLTTAAFLGYVSASSHPMPALPMPRTAEFATGDLGRIDSSGHLHLSGRHNNLLITAFGRNISPEWVEAVLLAQSSIAQAVVLGEAQPCLCAVLVPLPGATADQVSAAVVLANAELPDYARLGLWLISEPFTLQNKLATGNGRPLRTAIAQRHSRAIAALYNQKETP
jgi:long-subunit acyl-CoA synthetase (AMP-forming)